MGDGCALCGDDAVGTCCGECGGRELCAAHSITCGAACGMVFCPDCEKKMMNNAKKCCKKCAKAMKKDKDDDDDDNDNDNDNDGGDFNGMDGGMGGGMGGGMDMGMMM